LCFSPLLNIGPTPFSFCTRVLNLRTTTSQKCKAVPKRAQFQAHRLFYHSTLGSTVITKKRCTRALGIRSADRQPSAGKIALSGVNHSCTNVVTAQASNQFQVSGFGFQVSGCEFRSGFVIRLSGFGFGFWGFGPRFSVISFRVQGLGVSRQKVAARTLIKSFCRAEGGRFRVEGVVFRSFGGRV